MQAPGPSPPSSGRPVALVTGASQGIGRELAACLAAERFDLVLLARDEAKLSAAAEQLRSGFGVEVALLGRDLAEPGAAERVRAFADEHGLAVEMLVNNAGLLTNGPFHEAPLASQRAMLAVNVAALTELTHVFLPGMIERGHGHVLNVASTAAWTAIPEQSVYAASKAYVLAFSLGLHDELRARATGVKVTALCPGYTDTRMLDDPGQGGVLAIPESLVMDAPSVARAGVRGCLAGKPLVIPGAANVAAIAGAGLAPRRLVTRLLGHRYRHWMRTAAPRSG